MFVLLSGYFACAAMIASSAYFDASGTVDSPVLTVAGFVSSVKKWIRFEQEWNTTPCHAVLCHSI
jgi:hypothetical protein